MNKGVLSAEELNYFEKWGYVRVPQALSEQFVERVQAFIWGELEAQYGMAETDPSTWRPEWCGINKDKIDAATGTEVTERLTSAINQLLGGREWRPIKTYGGLLMTMPEVNPSAWEVVTKHWHFDNDPRSYIHGFEEPMLFTFYSPVEAQGGGTLALAGSHHLARAFVQSDEGKESNLNTMLNAFVTWHPYLAQLQGLQPREKTGAQWMETTSEVYGTEVFVAEFTGQPGDAILCHPALWHASSRNTASRPRIMRRTNVRRLRKHSERAKDFS
jgi:hypothetical protein